MNGKKFIPYLIVDKIWLITEEFLKNNNIKLLIVDIDNTLTTHNNMEINQEAKNWLENRKLPVVLVSNNDKDRVKPFAKGLNLPYIYNAKKPSRKKVFEICEKFKVNPAQVLLVGDQIFTDVYCGNRAGFKTVLVNPFDINDTPLIKFKRMFEKIYVKKYHKSKGDM